MAFAYSFDDPDGTYFTTTPVVQWVTLLPDINIAI
jgi:hypothetical protein